MKTTERGIKRRRSKLEWLLVAPIDREEMRGIQVAGSGGIGTTEEEAFSLGRERYRMGLGKRTYKAKHLNKAFSRGWAFQKRFSK